MLKCGKTHIKVVLQPTLTATLLVMYHQRSEACKRNSNSR